MRIQPTLISIVFLAPALLSMGATYTTNSPGNWSAAANWVSNSGPSMWWGAADTVYVNHAMTLNVNIGFAGVLIVNAGGSITGATRNISLNNQARAHTNGSISVQDISLNSTSSLTATAAISARHVSVESNSSFVTSGTTTLSGNFTVNGGSFSSTSSMSVANNFQINSAGGFNISGSLMVGNDMTLNSSTTSVFGSSVSIGNNFESNGANATFNGNVSVSNDADFNSGSNITINAQFEAGDDIESNGATISVGSSGTLAAVDDLTINGSSTINNQGSISAGDDITLNGGTVNNSGNFIAGDDITHNSGATLTNSSPGRIEAGDDYTKNGGTLTNNHHMVVGDQLTVNSGGTFNGNGKLQVERITNWGSISGTLDICNSSGTNPTLSGSGSYTGTITFCDDPSAFPLPVELISFEGKPSGQDVLLAWVTASERNNAFFSLERSSDGNTFYPIGDIAGAGTSNATRAYEYLDNQAPDGLVYYRLSQTDEHGNITLLRIIALERRTNETPNAKFRIYPNPVVDFLYVLSPDATILSLRLLDAVGQTHSFLDLGDEGDTNFGSLPVKGAAPGIWLLEIESTTGITRHKVLVAQ